jgi:hypothetical protein
MIASGKRSRVTSRAAKSLAARTRAMIACACRWPAAAAAAGTASSIAFAVAVVLVAGGAVLYFVMPKVTRRTAALSPALDGTVLRW